MKRNLLRRNILVLTCLLLSLIVNAQASWILTHENNGVKIYLNYDDCEYTLIKIVNETNTSKTIDWKEKVVDYLNESEIIMNSGLGKSISISGNSTLQGNCTDQETEALVVQTPSQFESIGDGTNELELFDVTIN